MDDEEGTSRASERQFAFAPWKLEQNVNYVIITHAHACTEARGARRPSRTREQANIHTRFMLLLRSMDGWTRRIVRGTARAQARGRERIGHHDDDDDDDDVSRLI